MSSVLSNQIALVKWTKAMGLTLVERDLKTMAIEAPFGKLLKYEILQLFPFTSEKKRMGIIVKVRREGGREGGGGVSQKAVELLNGN